MKTIIASLVLAAAAGPCILMMACSSSDSTSSTPTTTSDAGDTTTSAPSATRGLAIVTKEGCTSSSCHGADLGGSVKQPKGNYSANITFDDTGISTWTLTNLTNAFRLHTDDEGAPICGPMPVFAATEIDDQGVSDVYAYLMSVPHVSREQPNTDCNGNAVAGDDDDSGASTADAATDH